MVAMKCLGFMSFVPATLLVTVSFFVLIVLKKADTQWLRIFGYCVAVLLWIAAVLVFTAGIFHSGCGFNHHRQGMQWQGGDQRHGRFMDWQHNGGNWDKQKHQWIMDNKEGNEQGSEQGKEDVKGKGKK